MTQEQQKLIAGRRAAEFVQNDMVVGIGSGSTIAHVINALGERVAHENLKIVGVATSEKRAVTLPNSAYQCITSTTLIKSI